MTKTYVVSTKSSGLLVGTILASAEGRTLAGAIYEFEDVLDAAIFLSGTDERYYRRYTASELKDLGRDPVNAKRIPVDRGLRNPAKFREYAGRDLLVWETEQ